MCFYLKKKYNFNTQQVLTTQIIYLPKLVPTIISNNAKIVLKKHNFGSSNDIRKYH